MVRLERRRGERMPTRTPAYIVGSPRGRVGATTAARLLAEYCLSRRRGFVGVDTNVEAPAFARLFPEEVEVADLGSAAGQATLFDRLLRRDDAPRVVDVRARDWPVFVAMARETGFVEECRGIGAEPAFLLCVDDRGDYMDVVNDFLAMSPRPMLLLVHNAGAPSAGNHGASPATLFPSLRDIEIPALDSIAATALNNPRISLSSLTGTAPPGAPPADHAALRAWVAGMFAQFRAHELRAAMADGLE